MSLISWIKSLWSQASQKFKKFFDAALPPIKQEIIGLISDVAMQAVMRVDGSTVSNDEKRAKAFDEIKAYAIAHSIETKDHIIAIAIEMAVSALRGM